MVEFLKNLWIMNGILAGVLMVIAQTIGIIAVIANLVKK